MGFATDAIHVGQEPDPATGAIVPPIYQTSTFVQEELGKNKGFEYARTSNPTRTALERNLARLEGGSFAYAFASGMAAINALMSPYFQRPLALGADIVVHSTTKYLNGHSDGVGGAVILNDLTLADRLKFIQNAAGAILGPFDSWLVLRGAKTLAVRMQKHNENGLAVARFLARHPKVKKVHYPGLLSHPQHDLAKRQMTGFGGMLAFETVSLDNAK